MVWGRPRVRPVRGRAVFLEFAPMDNLIPLCSALALVLVGLVLMLTVIVPMVLGLFDGRR
jgi:hypothetical protein